MKKQENIQKEIYIEYDEDSFSCQMWLYVEAVVKYNDEGKFLESYTSIKEAADANNIKTPSNIINAIKGY